MGRPGGNKSTAIVAVDVDEKGQVRYDAIVKQGLGVQNKQLVHTTLDDLRTKKGDAAALQLPSEDEQAATAERTRLALEALVDTKIKQSKASTVAGAAPTAEEPTYIRYTPNPNAPGYEFLAGYFRTPILPHFSCIVLAITRLQSSV
jgi:SNW domain-containing protein 1